MLSDWARILLDSYSSFHSVAEISKARIRMAMHRKELTTISISSDLKSSTHVVVAICHNEAHRLSYFLKYYRDMGVEQFIFIDNSSQDGSLDILKDEEGCTVFSARGSYKKARFGIDWVNIVLKDFCIGKWILHVDADEFLCFPQSIGRNISDLTAYLNSRGDSSMNCLLLDMYSRKSIRHNHCDMGQNPFEVLKYYDADGYMMEEHTHTKTKWIKGGVRGRSYFLKKEWEGPALNKTPLVKWKGSFAFLKSAHQLWPFYLNQGSTGDHIISGALLHAKFLADFIGKIKSEQSRRQHSEEYDAYIDQVNADHVDKFYGDQSSLFVDWRSLVNDGLMLDPSGYTDDEKFMNSPFRVRVL